MNKTLGKYFLKEILPNFIFGFIIFLFVFFMTQIFKLADLIVIHGVDLKDIIKLLTFVVLPFIGMTFPVALLFAILISIGRMCQDSELIALRASGISLFEILKPIMIFSIFVYIISFVFSVFAEPWGFTSFKKLVFELGKSKISTAIKPGLFNEDFYNLVIYTDQLGKDNETMKNILLYDDRNKQRPLTVISKTGKIISDSDNYLITLRLHQGNILTHEREDNSFRKIDFDTYDINLVLTSGDEFSTGDPRSLSTGNLIKLINTRKKENKKAIREIIELNRRFSIPLACIIFAIFSTGLAGSTKNPRFSTGKGKAIVVSMVVLISYWILSLMGQTYARKEIISPIIVMWIPNIIYLIISIYVFKFAIKRN